MSRPIDQVSVLNARFIADAAAARGVDRAALLRSARIDPQQLADDQARIGYERVSALWNAAAAASGDDAFGLHLAEQLAPRDFGPLGLAVRSCRTAHEALDRLLGYARAVYQDTEIAVVREGAVGRFTHRFLGDPALATRHAAELILALFVVGGRRFLGIDWKPHLVTFRFAPPASVDEYYRIFSSPLRFEQPVNSVAFDASLLDLPMAQGDPEVLAVIDPYAEQFVQRLSTDRSLGEAVRRVVASALADGDPSLAATAGVLGTSPRTLQRRLREEGTSHREILDRVRCELALDLLRRNELSVEQIADRLGFSESSAFHRAFRRWTGGTPADQRRSAG